MSIEWPREHIGQQKYSIRRSGGVWHLDLDLDLDRPIAGGTPHRPAKKDFLMAEMMAG